MLKFVQITATGHANTSNTQSDWTLFALDADGCVWMQSNTDAQWTPLSMEVSND